jgi:hypothetical protein
MPRKSLPLLPRLRDRLDVSRLDREEHWFPSAPLPLTLSYRNHPTTPLRALFTELRSDLAPWDSSLSPPWGNTRLACTCRARDSRGRRCLNPWHYSLGNLPDPPPRLLPTVPPPSPVNLEALREELIRHCEGHDPDAAALLAIFGHVPALTLAHVLSRLIRDRDLTRKWDAEITKVFGPCFEKLEPDDLE